MVSGTNGNRTLKLLRDITEFGEWREAVVKDGTKLGLISTKGAIHTGHLGLIKRAGEISDLVLVVSSLCELQFGQNHEEFIHYPRNHKADLEILAGTGLCDAFLQLPSSQSLFPYGSKYGARVVLEDDIIPDWYDKTALMGECTALIKLINMTRAKFVFIGEDDILRARVLIRVVDDLMLTTQVITMPPIRDDSNVAYTGRLTNLPYSERNSLSVIYQALSVIIAAYLNDSFTVARLLQLGRAMIAEEGSLALNHIRIIHPYGFHDIEQVDPAIGAIANISVRMLRHRNMVIIDNAILAPRIPAHDEGLLSRVVWKSLLGTAP